MPLLDCEVSDVIEWTAALLEDLRYLSQEVLLSLFFLKAL